MKPHCVIFKMNRNKNDCLRVIRVALIMMLKIQHKCSNNQFAKAHMLPKRNLNIRGDTGCTTLPESTPPSQNILPFSTNLYVLPSQNLPLPPRIYPFLTTVYPTRRSQNLPPPLPGYTPFKQLLLCDPPRIYPSLPEYPPFSRTIYELPESTPPTQDIPPLLNNYNYATLPESTLPTRIYLIWASHLESTPAS